MKNRIKRLIREASAEGFLLRLRDGNTRAFDNNTAWSEMFLTQTDLFKGVSRESEVLQAVRDATPESREAFERKYGPIEMEACIICPEMDGGWVEIYKLHEDGRIEEVRHEGDSSEAERIRREAREPWGA